MAGSSSDGVAGAAESADVALVIEITRHVVVPATKVLGHLGPPGNLAAARHGSDVVVGMGQRRRDIESDEDEAFAVQTDGFQHGPPVDASLVGQQAVVLDLQHASSNLCGVRMPWGFLPDRPLRSVIVPMGCGPHCGIAIAGWPGTLAVTLHDGNILVTYVRELEC